MKFVDEVSITVSSGHGGPGRVSFLRISMTPRGGPDGGHGGRGGHVIFRVNPQLNTLVEYRFTKKFSAPSGGSGGGTLMSGADGEDLILSVPPGTVVRDNEGRVLLDLSEPGDTVFLKGGRGGQGNAFFRTSTNQAPTHAQPGEEGETREIHLELKLIADVGVIGYPNAGKSTLISRISAARPKIADYPFTTLVPNLGVIRIDHDHSVVVADIPGLVPGAHAGVGLGTQFLRHIERTGLFVHLIDVSSVMGGVENRNPLQDYQDILQELKEYDKTKLEDHTYLPLMAREQLVVLNKIDSIPTEELEQLIRDFELKGIKTRAISAVTGKGIKELVHEIGTLTFQKKAESRLNE
jgi:GTP-binding protein